MQNDVSAVMSVRVDPNQMVQYVHHLMTAPALARVQWGGNAAVERAAQLRWAALNRAFGDPRVGTWTNRSRGAQLQIPAALIAAAGVAPLKMSDDDVVFDIPTLLDATLELTEVAGHA